MGRILLAIAIVVRCASPQVLINEVQTEGGGAQPIGGGPSVYPLELRGTPGEAFTGVFVEIGPRGNVGDFDSVSGTFDENGLLFGRVIVRTPASYTIVLMDSFTGAEGTDIDTDDDGVPDDLSTFGTVLDAVGIWYWAGVRLYGTQLGGHDFWGEEPPQIVFRDGADPEKWYGYYEEIDASNLYYYDVIEYAEYWDLDGTICRRTFSTVPRTGHRTPSISTFGEPNPQLLLEGPTISEIQGSGPESPVVGSVVSVTGVVTALRTGGFFLQDLGDCDASTSDGIFVSTEGYAGDGVPPSVGDEVEVVGEVEESSTVTQLSNLASVTVLATGAPLPSPVVLVLDPRADGSAGAADAEFERREGMLVTLIPPYHASYYPAAHGEHNYFRMVYAETSRLADSGEVVVCMCPGGYDDVPGRNDDYPNDPQVPFTQDVYGRFVQFAQTEAPDVAAFAAFESTYFMQSVQGEPSLRVGCILIDDASSSSSPNPVLIGGQFDYADLDGIVRAGNDVVEASGPLHYSSDCWTLDSLTTLETYGVDNTRPSDPPAIGGDLKIVTTNVFNYFLTLGEGGADTQEELDRQTEKLVTALSALDADIYNLVEVENSDSAHAAQALADALNLAIPRRAYVAATAEAGVSFVGDDHVRVDVLYDSAKLTMVGTLAVLEDDDLDPGQYSLPVFNGPSTNRSPLAVTLRGPENYDLTLCVVHLKSKASGSGVNADQGDGQGASSHMRNEGARAVVEWLATNPTGVDTNFVLVAGDFNAYPKEDPIQTFIDADYVSLHDPSDYNVIFDAQIGLIDNSLASPALYGCLESSATWPVNADEADAIDYNLEDRDPNLFDPTSPFRFSDHDPLVVSFDFTQCLRFDVEVGEDGVCTYVDRVLGNTYVCNELADSGNSFDDWLDAISASFGGKTKRRGTIVGVLDDTTPSLLSARPIIHIEGGYIRRRYRFKFKTEDKAQAVLNKLLDLKPYFPRQGICCE